MRSFTAAMIGGILLILGTCPASGHEEPGQAGRAAAQDRDVGGSDAQTTRDYFTDLPLLDQDGKRVRFYTDVLKDRVVLLSFIFTTCTDACPLLTRKLSLVKDRLGEIFGKQVYFVSMSVDPARDTPQALASYAKQHGAEHPGWVFLTGEKRNLNTILRKLGQRAQTPEAHSTTLLAGNVGTRHWVRMSPAIPVEAVVARLQDLAAASPAIDRSRVPVGSGRGTD